MSIGELIVGDAATTTGFIHPFRHVSNAATLRIHP